LPLVVAITGASGAAYGVRLLEVLARQEIPVQLTVSTAGQEVIAHELGIPLQLNDFSPASLWPQLPPGEAAQLAKSIQFFHQRDLLAPIASGSHRTRGMVICPCSGGTLSAVVTGASQNLVHRAAEVHLKERRPLILVPRETPLSLVALKNMKAAHQAGATILPASPGWYHGVQSIQDLIDFIVARILDQLDIPHHLTRRWRGNDQ
jgi:4-hydroxy-3-polyprenylbenzoate decarboxylase